LRLADRVPGTPAEVAAAVAACVAVLQAAGQLVEQAAALRVPGAAVCVWPV
jgi:hypothetical protein